ncbi:MAG: hypothetical protein Q8M92_07820, partial [Candidatus Subteraquimicrobiales bacterium]|nr:hypothetical protein [Candidatus Subteraquimicrobiales bacterium]
NNHTQLLEQLKDIIWQDLSRTKDGKKEKKEMLRATKGNLSKKTEWQNEWNKDQKAEETEKEAKKMLFNQLKDALFASLIAYLAKMNLVNLRQARINVAKAQPNQHKGIINKFIRTIWPNLPLDLRTALYDLNDNNSSKTRKAVFDEMNRLNKDEARKTADKQLQSQVKGLLNNSNILVNLRQARINVAPLQSKLDDLSKNKVSQQELNANWQQGQDKQKYLEQAKRQLSKDKNWQILSNNKQTEKQFYLAQKLSLEEKLNRKIASTINKFIMTIWPKLHLD